MDNCLTERTEREEKGDGSNSSSPRHDFFHYLYHAVDSKTGRPGYDSKDELYGEIESLVIAGADTTASSLAAMFFYLAQEQKKHGSKIQDRLAREVREAFPNLDDIKGGPCLMQDCKYLRAFIQESLRMTPPVASEPSREVREGGIWVDGEYFPAGTKLSTGLYCLSYHPTYFPEPFRFRPERWIAREEGEEDDGSDRGDSADQVALAESAFCAFSTGPRGCPGKSLAWLEMMIVMAKVVHRFEVVRPANGSVSKRVGGGDPQGRPGRRNADQYQIYDAFVAMRDGPMVQFRARS